MIQKRLGEAADAANASDMPSDEISDFLTVNVIIRHIIPLFFNGANSHVRPCLDVCRGMISNDKCYDYCACDVPYQRDSIKFILPRFVCAVNLRLVRGNCVFAKYIFRIVSSFSLETRAQES